MAKRRKKPPPDLFAELEAAGWLSTPEELRADLEKAGLLSTPEELRADLEKAGLLTIDAAASPERTGRKPRFQKRNKRIAAAKANGATTKEIARRFRVSPGNVRVILCRHRAQQRFSPRGRAGGSPRRIQR